MVKGEKPKATTFTLGESYGLKTQAETLTPTDSRPGVRRGAELERRGVCKLSHTSVYKLFRRYQLKVRTYHPNLRGAQVPDHRLLLAYAAFGGVPY